jgi:hypothetical protein
MREQNKGDVYNNGDIYYVIDTQETEKAAREVGEPGTARVL